MLANSTVVNQSEDILRQEIARHYGQSNLLAEPAPLYTVVTSTVDGAQTYWHYLIPLVSEWVPAIVSSSPPPLPFCF